MRQCDKQFKQKILIQGRLPVRDTRDAHRPCSGIWCPRSHAFTHTHTGTTTTSQWSNQYCEVQFTTTIHGAMREDGTRNLSREQLL